MSSTRRSVRARLVAGALALLASQALLLGPHPVREAKAAPRRPNILIVVTDDQRPRGTMGVMPATRRWLGQGGRRYMNAFATTPLCCPSRASIFTGQYVHNHNVRTNLEGDLPQRETMQRYLDNSGYRTGIFGKYLNRWDMSRRPPHFDRWAIFDRSKYGYRGGQWNVNGNVRKIRQYSTGFIKRSAIDFLEQSEAGSDGKPWFLYLAPAAPHDPYTPQPKYADARVGKISLNPAVYEDDRSDKPAYVRTWWKSPSRSRDVARKQLRTLMSVDDMMGRLRQTLGKFGESRRTLVIFMSDNGFLWGEHRLLGSIPSKNNPYTNSIGIPMYARWPGHIPAGTKETRFTANIDVARTVLDAAGLRPDPDRPMDGRSLLKESWRRPRLFTEYFQGGRVPTWASIRTRNFQYVEYYADDNLTVTFREYYNLRSDPWQLRNVYGDGDPSNNPIKEPMLSAELQEYRNCKGSSSCP